MSQRPKDAQRNVQDLEFLCEVTRETLSSLNLDTILRRVAQLMRHRFGYDYAAVALVEGDHVVFRAGSWGELDVAQGDRLGEHRWRVPVGTGLVGTAAALQRTRLANRVEEDPDYLAVSFLDQTRSELSVPMVHRNRVLGVLDVQSHNADAFDDGDVRLLEIVSALVAPAVHTASLYEEEMRQARHLRLVSEISTLVMFSLESASVISVACQAIRETLDVNYVGVGLLDRERQQVLHAGHSAVKPRRRDAGSRAGLHQGVMGQVVTSGSSLMLDDTAALPGILTEVEGSRSVLCVPLRVREGIIGAVVAEHDPPFHFTQQDEALLTSVAAYLAQATENAQLFEDQRRRWQQLLLINEVTRIATETFDLEQILRQVAREVHDRFGYFATAVTLVDDEESVLRAVACDEPLDLRVGTRAPLARCATGQVVHQRSSVLLGEGELLENCVLRRDIRAVLAVPLMAGREVIGAIQAQSPEPGAFSDDDRLVLETLSRSVAGAIANARSIRRAEQLREDLTRMIVHDLRNPVQALLLTLREVERGAAGTLQPLVARALGEGTQHAERILGLVNSLLDLARFEAGQAKVRLTPAVLHDHIRDVARRNTAQARTRGIAIDLLLSEAVPVLWIDPDLISRALNNLVDNALKFSPDQGRVVLSTELWEEARTDCDTPPPFVLVSVKDSGEGIPARFQRKIFEKFGQVESRKAGLKMSTGLGLALCRYVVEAHGGAIWVESNLGRGSTFRFTLPVVRPG